MARVLKADLNLRDIARLRKFFLDYENDLKRKCQVFVNELADIGITEANSHLGSVIGSDLIYFQKQFQFVQDGAMCIIVPFSGTYISEWINKSGIQSAEVTPLLMAEFGSGQFAIDGHRGTFPTQTAQYNANRPDGWYWRRPSDPPNVLHHSKGLKPTRPVFHAVEEMKSQIHDVAMRVFTA